MSTLKTIIRDRVYSLNGNEFQKFCDQLLLELYPDDYTPVKSGGPKGDDSNDGYCPKKRIFFAAYAPEKMIINKTKDKITNDLKRCTKKHNSIKEWIFVTNQILVGEIQTYIDDELRLKYPKLKIRTWDQNIISQKIIKLTSEQQSHIIPDIYDLMDSSQSLQNTIKNNEVYFSSGAFGGNGHSMHFQVIKISNRSKVDIFIDSINVLGTNFPQNKRINSKQEDRFPAINNLQYPDNQNVKYIECYFHDIDNNKFKFITLLSYHERQADEKFNLNLKLFESEVIKIN